MSGFGKGALGIIIRNIKKHQCIVRSMISSHKYIAVGKGLN